ncbi:hypothetical protein THIOSC15_3050003 [uncultured Thiomicrorhabdus sp.]
MTRMKFVCTSSVFPKHKMTDTRIAETLGTTKGNFSKFPDVFDLDQRKYVLNWLWENGKNVPPELKAS